MLTTGQTISERYQIISEIGAGDLGPVYKAVDAQTGRAYAARVLPEGLMPEEMLARQIRSLLEGNAGIKAPNLATARISGISDEGRPFILRDYVEGETLAAVMARDGAFSLPRFAAILQQIAAALEAGHQAGAVHGSLHPNNILLTTAAGSETVWITDWCIPLLKAKQLYEVGRLTLKASGALMGKPAYYAPEQALGRHGSQIDCRTDLYALGLISYQMLTGRHPFTASNEMEWLLAQVFNEPPDLHQSLPGAHIPASIESLILKLLSKNREARPSNAEAVIEALRDARPAKAMLTEPVVVKPAGEPAPRRSPDFAEVTLSDLKPEAPPDFFPASQPPAAAPQLDLRAESPLVTQSTAIALQPEVELEKPLAKPRRNAIAQAMERSNERALPNHGSVLFGSGTLTPAARPPAHQPPAAARATKPPKGKRAWMVAAIAAAILIAAAAGTVLLNPADLALTKRLASNAITQVKHWQSEASTDAAAKTQEAPPAAATSQSENPAQQPSATPAVPQAQAGASPVASPAAPSTASGAPAGNSSPAAQALHPAGAPAGKIATPQQNVGVTHPARAGNDSGSIARALERGDYFFKLGEYDNAISAYNEGLSSHRNNKILASRIERAMKAKAAEQEYLNQ
jgi:serine/threonine protein kinase